MDLLVAPLIYIYIYRVIVFIIDWGKLYSASIFQVHIVEVELECHANCPVRCIMLIKGTAECVKLHNKLTWNAIRCTKNSISYIHYPKYNKAMPIHHFQEAIPSLHNPSDTKSSRSGHVIRIVEKSFSPSCPATLFGKVSRGSYPAGQASG